MKVNSSFERIKLWLANSQFTVKQRVALDAAITDAAQEYSDDYWDDLRFPAAGLNPPGPINAPTTDPDTGLLVFADSATRVVAGVAQMPHSWKEGSIIEPHVHWIQPAAGNVVWQLEYKLIPAVNDAVPAAFTTVTSDNQVAAYPGSGDWVQISTFPGIDMTGFTLSAMVIFKLSRLGNDANDTVAASVSLLEFDIHYQVDTPGSRQEFIK